MDKKYPAEGGAPTTIMFGSINKSKMEAIIDFSEDRFALFCFVIQRRACSQAVESHKVYSYG